MSTTIHETTTPISPAAYTMREARSATREQWNGWLQGAPGGGHIYQSHEWGEFKRTIGWRPIRLLLECDNAIVGAGQFLAWSTPGVPGCLLYCTKGPWLPWDDEQAVRTFFAGVRTVARRENAHTVKIEPEVLEEQTAVKAVLTDIGFEKFRWDLQFKTTMLVDLTPSEEELLAAMKSKTRYNTRLGAKKGVRIVEDNSLEAREEFHTMMELTAQRDGFFKRPHNYLFACWQAMYDADRAHLFFAVHEEQKLAGILIFTFGHKYWYTVGASTDEKRNLMPTYQLQWEVVRWAKEQGITFYDMVAIPNPENLNEEDSMYGLYRFKAGFGGRVAEFVGCLDLPVASLRAAAWNRVEPLYYRAYKRLKHDVYY
ncbi:MAG: peptidoglycan bridge formation glycyltransferase FemA/FemB family protein [Chloroflexia bacterium]|nr:peptidoglycan bridge formation glycyltransferase FemA/FemB family protein [Chloroflexia bacterium]